MHYKLIINIHMTSNIESKNQAKPNKKRKRRTYLEDGQLTKSTHVTKRTNTMCGKRKRRGGEKSNTRVVILTSVVAVVLSSR